MFDHLACSVFSNFLISAWTEKSTTTIMLERAAKKELTIAVKMIVFNEFLP